MKSSKRNKNNKKTKVKLRDEKYNKQIEKFLTELLKQTQMCRGKNQ